MQTKEITGPIAYIIQDQDIVVTNPCSIPFELLEDAIKKHREAKHKKGEVTVCCTIMIPHIFKKKGGKHGKRSKRIN